MKKSWAAEESSSEDEVEEIEKTTTDNTKVYDASDLFGLNELDIPGLLEKFATEMHRNNGPNRDRNYSTRDNRSNYNRGSNDNRYKQGQDRYDKNRPSQPPYNHNNNIDNQPPVPPTRTKIILEPRSLPVEKIGERIPTAADIFGQGKPQDEKVYVSKHESTKSKDDFSTSEKVENNKLIDSYQTMKNSAAVSESIQSIADKAIQSIETSSDVQNQINSNSKQQPQVDPANLPFQQSTVDRVRNAYYHGDEPRGNHRRGGRHNDYQGRHGRSSGRYKSDYASQVPKAVDQLSLESSDHALDVNDLSVTDSLTVDKNGTKENRPHSAYRHQFKDERPPFKGDRPPRRSNRYPTDGERGGRSGRGSDREAYRPAATKNEYDKVVNPALVTNSGTTLTPTTTTDAVVTPPHIEEASVVVNPADQSGGHNRNQHQQTKLEADARYSKRYQSQQGPGRGSERGFRGSHSNQHHVDPIRQTNYKTTYAPGSTESSLSSSNKMKGDEGDAPQLTDNRDEKGPNYSTKTNKNDKPEGRPPTGRIFEKAAKQIVPIQGAVSTKGQIVKQPKGEAALTTVNGDETTNTTQEPKLHPSTNVLKPDKSKTVKKSFIEKGNKFSSLLDDGDENENDDN